MMVIIVIIQIVAKSVENTNGKWDLVYYNLVIVIRVDLQIML